MEDLKQIQEFFSKPLEEGEQLDIIDFAKVVKAVHQTGHPVTVLLTPKFNEIEVLTGMNAPDDIYRDLSNAVDSLGYGRNEIIIAGDSSNLSRREYSDIRRVNGGHKDYFEESVNEERKLTYNDFVRMVRDDMMAGAAPDERPSEELVGKRAKAYYNEYLQGASVDDLFEAKVEVDDKTEFKLDLKHLLDKHVVEQGYSLTKEHETDPNLELKIGDYQTQHFHMCPGAKSLYQDIENKVEDMGLAIRSAKLQDALFAMEESALENGANEADVFAAETIADQIMAMAAMMGLDKEHSYIQGHVDKIKGAVDKGQVAEDKSDAIRWFSNLKFYYQKAFRELQGEDRETYKQLAKDFFSKLEIDQYVRPVGLEESASTEEKRIAKRAIRSIAKYRGVSDDEARNDLIRAANELGSLEKAIKEMFETIQLGKQLNEELCDKGKRYIKARQAAGEKSSAYLSGRAVRVCKGQIEWPKKGKKK